MRSAALALPLFLLSACSAQEPAPQKTTTSSSSTSSTGSKTASSSSSSTTTSTMTSSTDAGADAADAEAQVEAGVDEAGVDATMPVPNLVLPDNCNDGGANAGSRWQDLYACYFGSTTGVASCAGSPDNCHGSTSDNGYTGSLFLGGFECPPADAATCWMSMTSVLIGDAGAEAGADAGPSPPSTVLYQVLRQDPSSSCGNYLCMPLDPSSLVFGPGDMARIGSWISRGAPND